MTARRRRSARNQLKRRRRRTCVRVASWSPSYILLDGVEVHGGLSLRPSDESRRPPHVIAASLPHRHAIAATSHAQVRFLHWKDKTRTRRRAEVCSIINANTTARLILGLSKCGMHGDEPVRLKRLKRPWIDQD